MKVEEVKEEILHDIGENLKDFTFCNIEQQDYGIMFTENYVIDFNSKTVYYSD